MANEKHIQVGEGPRCPSFDCRLPGALGLFLLMILVLTGCSYEGPRITVKELRTRLADREDKITLFDIRATKLFKKSHIRKAKPLPSKYIRNEIHTIKALKGDIVMICENGRESRAAGNLLKGEGVQIILVEGGYEAWIEAGFPVKEKKKKK